jgi:hypothetical protein
MMSPKVRSQVLEAEFPYGVLLIPDAESKEEIPSWDSAEEQVAVAGSALVVRVQNADEREVTVRICDSPVEPPKDAKVLSLADAQRWQGIVPGAADQLPG